MEINFFFSANVHQYNITFVLCIHVQVCFNLFYFIFYFFLPCQGSSQLKEVVFVIPVGLYELKITTANPILTIMFKNILRTFEAEILKIFKNIQPQPKN